MTVFKNSEGKLIAYLPIVKIVDPACADYRHSKQDTYNDCCQDIINCCDIGIEKLKTLRETYERRMVSNQMGVNWSKLEGGG